MNVDTPSGSTQSPVRQAMLRRLQRRAVVKGEIVLPAVPGMLEEYITLCDETFRAIGVEFSKEDFDHMRGILSSQLAQAYAASPRSDIVIASSWSCVT